MKAFVVSVIAPNEWTSQDVVTAVNIGMRKYCGTEDGKHLLSVTSSSLCTAVTVVDKFDLKRQDI